MATMNSAKFIQHWLGQVAEAALPFEANWTWRSLKGVDPKLCRLLRKQRDAFDRALVVKEEKKDIAAIGAATVLGYQRAVECMRRSDAKIERVSVAKQGPNLQDLVAKHGGYDKIPEPAWEQFEREKIVWRAKLRFGEFDKEDDPSQQEEALR